MRKLSKIKIKIWLFLLLFLLVMSPVQFLFAQYTLQIIRSIVSVIPATSFSYTYDVTTPAGSDSPTILDDRIREVKLAVEERLDVDHYFHKEDGTASQVDAADTGKHRQIQFYERINFDDFTIDSNEGLLGMKAYGGKGELCWKDEDENELLLTSGGRLVINDANIAADEVNEVHIEITNDAWFVWSNQAGTGDVNAMKVDVNDVVIIAENAQLASGIDANDANNAIADKAYVDAVETTGGGPGSVDSEANSLVKSHAYKAQTAGFVNAHAAFPASLSVYVGSTTDPAGAGTRVAITSTASSTQGSNTGTAFVAKNWYFEVTSSGTPSIYWTPLISGGGAPIDQD